jgi:type III secretory pathway component EscT
LCLAGIVLGWLSRAASSLPFIALALPIRSFLGVVLVLLSLGALVTTLSGAWDRFPWTP